MFIVLFNGPPRTGKDTGALIARAELERLMLERGDTFPVGHGMPQHLKFATPMKDAIHRFFGMGLGGDKFHTYDGIKDDKRVETFRFSLRELYISLSETWAKPKFGIDVFGKLMAQRIKDTEWGCGTRVFVISDCGFQSEVNVLLDTFKTSDFLLIRLHRKGHTFAGDSRQYVAMPGYEHEVDISNDMPKAEYEKLIREVVGTWFNTVIARRLTQS